METVRVAAEDRKHVRTVIGGTEYQARDGYFHLRPEHVQAHLQSANLPTPPAGRPVRRGGYRCEACGFASYFKVCGRCEAPCDGGR